MDRAGRRCVKLGADADAGRLAGPRRLRSPGPDRPRAQGPRAHRPPPDPGRARGLRPPALTLVAKAPGQRRSHGLAFLSNGRPWRCIWLTAGCPQPMGGGRRRSQGWRYVMTESDRQYSAGTVEHNATEQDQLFAAAGKKSGHGISGRGTIAWLPAPDYAMPDSPDWQPTAPPPVSALLDTGVQPQS